MMLALGLSITVTWIVLLTTIFIYTAQSHSSIEDKALEAIAIRILLSIPSDKELAAQGQGLQLRDGVQTDVEHLTFQVWAGRNRLVGSTPDAPETPLRPDFAEGFAYSDIAGETWRAFSISDRSGRVHVQVGRPRRAVDEHFRHEGLVALIIATLLLGLAGLFMWAVVRKSLAPIRAVADGVKDRQKFDLAPLPSTGLPNEVRPLVESFNQLLHQLDEAVQAERRFIGDAAHELRTPLSALYGQAEVALRASTMADKD